MRAYTLPAWSNYFNPRSPCGERRCEGDTGNRQEQFQPTLPVRGATEAGCETRGFYNQFQPTLPVRGATS